MKCVKCGTEVGRFEYCPKCEPVMAQAERAGVVEAFDDVDSFDMDDLLYDDED